MYNRIKSNKIDNSFQMEDAFRHIKYGIHLLEKNLLKEKIPEDAKALSPARSRNSSKTSRSASSSSNSSSRSTTPSSRPPTPKVTVEPNKPKELNKKPEINEVIKKPSAMYKIPKKKEELPIENQNARNKIEPPHDFYEKYDYNNYHDDYLSNFFGGPIRRPMRSRGFQGHFEGFRGQRRGRGYPY